MITFSALWLAVFSWALPPSALGAELGDPARLRELMRTTHQAESAKLEAEISELRRRLATPSGAYEYTQGQVDSRIGRLRESILTVHRVESYFLEQALDPSASGPHREPLVLAFDFHPGFPGVSMDGPESSDGLYWLLRMGLYARKPVYWSVKLGFTPAIALLPVHRFETEGLETFLREDESNLGRLPLANDPGFVGTPGVWRNQRLLAGELQALLKTAQGLQLEDSGKVCPGLGSASSEQR